MKIRTLVKTLLVILSLSAAIPGFSSDKVAMDPTTPTANAPSPEVQRMLNRLDEIKAMDVKNLPRSERRALRKEVKEIDQKLQQSGYVYISVGALIIIILLLILLL